MHKTLLIEVLATFDTPMLRKWHQYTTSNYSLSHAPTRELAAYCYQLAPDWQHAGWLKKTAWQKLYPGTPYKELSFNNYISDLLQATFQFIVTEKCLLHPRLYHTLLSEYLVEKNLPKAAHRSLQKWLSTDSHHLDSSEQLLQQIAQYQTTDLLELKQTQRHFTPTLQLQSTSLDHYYLLQQLKLYCEMLNRSHIVQGSYAPLHLKYLLNKYEANEQQEQDQPAIAIYYHLAQLLQGNDALSQLITLEQLIPAHPLAMSMQEKRTLFNYLLNYCVQRINQGDASFYLRVFRLYQELIAESLLLEDGQITQWAYTNIITTASRLSQWDWALDFLETYKAHLPKAALVNAYHYNLAALRYEQKLYKEALAGLNKVEFTDAFYQLAAKTIQLKIYYELQENDAFHALLAASKQFIMRNKQISSAKKNAYQSFLKLVRKLFLLKTQRDYWPTAKWKNQHALLHAELSTTTTNINHRDWLLEALEAL
ncbi:MAG: hypothetical protein R2795_15060 [Saprospiraceae bacterium]